MKRMVCLVLALFIGQQAIWAAEKPDTNIVIASAKERYEFVYNKKTEKVEVKQTLDLLYRCNDYKADVPVIESYNDQVSMDNIEIEVDGRRNKAITPNCEFFSVDGIFYSDARTCYFMLPLTKRGGESHVVFEKTVKDPRYFTSIFFREPLNIRFKQVEIIVPRWMKLELKEYHFEGYNVSKKTTVDNSLNADITTYTITNLPAQVRERAAPGPTYTEPHLLVLCKSAAPEGKKITFFSTLADQYAWYHNITANPNNDEAILKTKAQEITKGLTNDMDKIKAIFYWVQNNIRYIAFEDGIAGFKPEKANEVLRKKYGDCKGMAHLTKELLRSLGFDARLCWIGTNHIAYDYSTPALCVDNHMICGLNYQGKVYFLDATENYIGLGEYAERIQGRQVLMEDGDNYKLLNVPATTYHQNTDVEKRVITINGTDISGTAEHEWKGEEKENILAQLNSIKKDKASEAFIKYLGDGNADVHITDFVTSDLNNFDKNVTATYKLTQKNAVSTFGKEMYIDLDFRKELNDFTFKKDERTSDYWFGYKSDMLRETILNIPPGYTVTSVPKNLTIKNDFFEASIDYTQQPGKLVYKKSLIIKNTKLPKNKFEQWNADIEKLQAAYNEQVVLTAK